MTDPMTGLLGSVREVVRYQELVKNLVVRDLKIKYKSSVLGFLWSLLNPLLMLVVYTFAFRVVMHQPGDFAFYFIVGYLPWNFFAQSLAFGVGAIVDNGALLKKVYFPREILPLSLVLSTFVQFLLTFLILPPMYLYFGHTIGLSIVWLPVILALHIGFTLGIAMVLATVYVYFRDTRHFVEILLNVWFWFTPIVYRLSMVEGDDPLHVAMVSALKLNPMTVFLEAYRAVLFHARFPEPMLMAQVAGWSVLALLFGSSLFGRYKLRFAEAI